MESKNFAAVMTGYQPGRGALLVTSELSGNDEQRGWTGYMVLFWRALDVQATENWQVRVSEDEKVNGHAEVNGGERME